MFADDVARTKPDVILAGCGVHIDRVWSHAAISGAMAGYRKAQTVSEIEIWLPR